MRNTHKTQRKNYERKR